MNNIFLIVTNDKITLDQKIKEILKGKDEEVEIVHYDLMEVAIDRVIEDLDTYNFLVSQKVIIGHNAYFLSSDRVKTTVEHDLEKLEKYIENPSSENILILICDSLDKRKKITQILSKKATVIEESRDIRKLITSYLDGYQMDNSSIQLLLDYCRGEQERLFHELDKLKLYKLEERVITKEDVELLVSKNLDDNIFHLADSILSKNKKEAFELYQNFMINGEQVVNIIRIVANKIRLIYQVKVLLSDGNSDQAISKILKVHEYPVKLAREASYRYNEKVLLEDLKKLADLDLNIKSGNTTGEVEFEMLLATI